MPLPILHREGPDGLKQLLAEELVRLDGACSRPPSGPRGASCTGGADFAGYDAPAGGVPPAGRSGGSRARPSTGRERGVRTVRW